MSMKQMNPVDARSAFRFAIARHHAMVTGKKALRDYPEPSTSLVSTNLINVLLTTIGGENAVAVTKMFASNSSSGLCANSLVKYVYFTQSGKTRKNSAFFAPVVALALAAAGLILPVSVVDLSKFDKAKKKNFVKRMKKARASWGVMQSPVLTKQVFALLTAEQKADPAAVVQAVHWDLKLLLADEKVRQAAADEDEDDESPLMQQFSSSPNAVEVASDSAEEKDHKSKKKSKKSKRRKKKGKKRNRSASVESLVEGEEPPPVEEEKPQAKKKRKKGRKRIRSSSVEPPVEEEKPQATKTKTELRLTKLLEFMTKTAIEKEKVYPDGLDRKCTNCDLNTLEVFTNHKRLELPENIPNFVKNFFVEDAKHGKVHLFPIAVVETM